MPLLLTPKVGILGGGQLGRMLALAGYPLGITCQCLEPAKESAAAQVSERISGEFEDLQKLYELAKSSDVITLEFENVPVESTQWLSERVPVYPPPNALAIAQDRIQEKTFFRDLGIPVPAFRSVESRGDLDAAISELGLPAVLKTCRFGYDGKGQAMLTDPTSVDAAWERLGGRPLIYEAKIDFDREVSLIAVRSALGETAFYPLVENHHREGMLRRTLAPAPNLSPELQRLAESYAETAMRAMDYVGVLAIEFFQQNDRLMVNEMAPRVHNSGHWTIEGAETSQFENHLRAILGWPLGSTRLRGLSAMVNLIGFFPNPEVIHTIPGGHWHHYGKTERAGRKIGHVTFCAQTESERTWQLAHFPDHGK
ncbi:5-(carboxyamino)imidazole ribonucleotide synthase [Tuwongella immobilis]|nr:5-(carboxyamino)imidazole ribonucleotide synthase [Tuwongella immobilis]